MDAVQDRARIARGGQQPEEAHQDQQHGGDLADLTRIKARPSRATPARGAMPRRGRAARAVCGRT